MEVSEVSEVSIDPEKAKEMIGKVVLVSIAKTDHNENIISVEQYFGTVLRINLRDGLLLCRGDNEEIMSLPPTLERYEKAEPGKYKLKPTGRTIKNPDYLFNWALYPSPRDENTAI